MEVYLGNGESYSLARKEVYRFSIGIKVDDLNDFERQLAALSSVVLCGL